MPTRRQLIGAGAGSLALIGVGMVAGPTTRAQDATPTPQGSDDQEDNGYGTPVIGTPILRPAIDLIRAQEIALEGNADASVLSLDLDGSDGVLAYSVVLDNGQEVEVDATSGAVIKTEPTDEEDDGNGNGGEDNGNGDDGEDNGNGDNGQNGDGGDSEDGED
jgi:hypothetical protein